MKVSPILDRLSGLGSAKWEVHYRARVLQAEGRDIIDLTIGNPDIPTPPELINAAIEALHEGRTQYSSGRGEARLCAALADRYTRRTGRRIIPEQVLCFPGTQTALTCVMMGLAEPGTEVIVADPMYATYEAVIAASGATAVPVPLRAENGFRLLPGDIATRVTPRTRVILLNTPHNPTGSVLRADDIAAIGKIAIEHDLWIVADEVYEELTFDGIPFTSPFDRQDLCDRTVVVASISKSHAAPGFRSGWSVSSAEVAERLLPLSETLLFGNQPFIADMTAQAVAHPSVAAEGMRRRFARRAARLAGALAGTNLAVHQPEAGMFALVDLSATGSDDQAFAHALLEERGVAVMPGSAFGATLAGWVRVALTVDDARFDLAAARIRDHALTGRRSEPA